MDPLPTAHNNIKLPEVKGEYRFDFSLAKTTWFQVGGNADILFKPSDEDDLATFLKNKPAELPVIVLGVCSNIIIRDGGFRGVVIKLGRNFTNISVDDGFINAGATALDINVANFAAQNSIFGLEFLSGIPGTIGGAIAMNAGAYGGEVKDVLHSATAVDLKGNIKTINNSEFGFIYRKHSIKEPLIFTSAKFIANKGNADEINARMQQITTSREATQPVRSKTGGSTFKNPEGNKAWQLIDEAGCRGLKIGGAQVSELHCNFLINTGDATANDIESLGEEVRKRVYEKSGVMLEWEIKIIGEK